MLIVFIDWNLYKNYVNANDLSFTSLYVLLHFLLKEIGFYKILKLLNVKLSNNIQNNIHPFSMLCKRKKILEQSQVKEQDKISYAIVFA